MLAYTRYDRVVAFILVCSIFLLRVHGIRDIFQIEHIKQGDVINGGAAGHLLPKGCDDAYVHNPKARESQSCSLGLTKPFVGPLDTWTSVRAMLQARSRNGEVRMKFDCLRFRSNGPNCHLGSIASPGSSQPAHHLTVLLVQSYP